MDKIMGRSKKTVPWVAWVAALTLAALLWLPAAVFGQSGADKGGPAADFPFPDEGDFSRLGWAEAFFAMHDFFSRSYAFGDWKQIPWDRLKAIYGRRIWAAESTGDKDAYRIAMQEYLKEIPDGHLKISSDYSDLSRRFIGGSFGLGLARLDDGSVIAAAVRPDGPAGEAGLPAGAHILFWNGVPVDKALGAADTRWFKGAATREDVELERLQALGRAQAGSHAVIQYQVPGLDKLPAEAAEPRSIELVAADDNYADLGLFDLAPVPSAQELRKNVVWRIMEDGIGYVRIYHVLHLDDMTVYPHEVVDEVSAALSAFKAAGVTSLVLDLRGNRGGSDQVAADIAGFFAPQPAFYEKTAWYSAKTGRFELAYSDLFAQTFEAGGKEIDVIPREPHFGGKIAVLVNPATISSGEGLAMAVGRLPNAAVIGFNGTHGSFGLMSWPIAMPEDIRFEYPIGRSLAASGKIQIDADATGSGGVRPEIRVPRTANSMKAYASGVDVELARAKEWLMTGRSDSVSLSLEQKIGQMVMMGFAGTSADDPAVKTALGHIRKAELGGVIFYGYNVENPEQVRRLTRAFAEANPLPLPLPIAIDQEGGLVQRLKASNGFFSTPSAENVVADFSPAGARNLYASMAAMLKDAGFTWNFAPVVDLRGDPNDLLRAPVSPVIGQLQRSFSENPATIVRYASAFVEAHREQGVVTSLKHYPGHGLATTDSHLGLVDITDTARPVEAEPFCAMIRGGLADSIMTAHLLNRNVDPENPVTLSPGYMDRELRAKTGFDGVVVTDDLHMGAIQRYHSFEDTVIKAILAGDDVLIFSNNPQAAQNVSGFIPDYDVCGKVIQVVIAAIGRGEISEARIDASWRRIQALRRKMR